MTNICADWQSAYDSMERCLAVNEDPSSDYSEYLI